MVIILFAILAGILGRMGGATNFNTKYRDLGIPFLFVGYQLLTRHSIINIPYFLTFGLLFAALTTYWDWLFKDIDTFWFSGFIVGLALLPVQAWQIVLIKAVLLGVVWEAIHRYMPKLWFKERGVAEELARYSLTFLILAV